MSGETINNELKNGVLQRLSIWRAAVIDTVRSIGIIDNSVNFQLPKQPQINHEAINSATRGQDGIPMNIVRGASPGLDFMDDVMDVENGGSTSAGEINENESSTDREGNDTRKETGANQQATECDASGQRGRMGNGEELLVEMKPQSSFITNRRDSQQEGQTQVTNSVVLSTIARSTY